MSKALLYRWMVGKYDSCVEIQIHSSPSKTNYFEIGPNPSHPGDGNNKHNFAMQIWTFHAIPSKNIC